MHRTAIPRLLALFYVHFHPSRGPTVLHFVSAQLPLSLLPSLPLLSDFLIPKRLLSAHILAILVNNNILVAYPIYIINEERYHRNDFMFSLCFVFKARSEAGGWMHWEPVIRKAGSLLQSLEEEDGWVSENMEFGDALKNIIEQMFEDLNTYGECRIPISN